MAEAKHTPAPWWRDDDGFIAVGHGDTYRTLADFDCSPDIDIDEREANKALAIAAPDMLDILKGAVSDWSTFENADEPVNGGDMVEWFGGFYQKAKAAIAKAEGRSNG